MATNRLEEDIKNLARTDAGKLVQAIPPVSQMVQEEFRTRGTTVPQTISRPQVSKSEFPGRGNIDYESVPVEYGAQTTPQGYPQYVPPQRTTTFTEPELFPPRDEPVLAISHERFGGTTWQPVMYSTPDEPSYETYTPGVGYPQRTTAIPLPESMRDTWSAERTPAGVTRYTALDKTGYMEVAPETEATRAGDVIARKRLFESARQEEAGREALAMANIREREKLEHSLSPVHFSEAEYLNRLNLLSEGGRVPLKTKTKRLVMEEMLKEIDAENKRRALLRESLGRQQSEALKAQADIMKEQRASKSAEIENWVKLQKFEPELQKMIAETAKYTADARRSALEMTNIMSQIEERYRKPILERHKQRMEILEKSITPLSTEDMQRYATMSEAMAKGEADWLRKREIILSQYPRADLPEYPIQGKRYVIPTKGGDMEVIWNGFEMVPVDQIPPEVLRAYESMLPTTALPERKKK